MSIEGKLSRFNWSADNWGVNPSATPGTLVTPGASNAWGSITSILSALANEAHALNLRIMGGATTTAAKPQVMEVYYDPAGGTSWTQLLIPAFPMGASALITQAGSGYSFLFPIRIPAGASVGVRIKGANATAGTVSVSAKVYGKPSSPENAMVGSYAEVVGTITNALGVTFTPGNAADGSWVDLGATVKDLWWWQIAYQINGSTITAEYTYIDIAFGDASNKHVIARIMHAGTTGESCGTPMEDNMSGQWECYQPVKAGDHIYIRGRCLNAPDTGYNGAAIGVGG